MPFHRVNHDYGSVMVTADDTNYATVTAIRAAIGDWERYPNGGWWRRLVDDRAGHVLINDGAEPGVFRALVCGTLLGERCACPDAARETADKALVAAGKLEASRAFVRLGEWEEIGTGCWGRRSTDNGIAWAGDGDRVAADARLVRLGALDPARAFKAWPTHGLTVTAMHPGPRPSKEAVEQFQASGAWPQNTATRMQPEKYDSVPRTAKPTWGEWERVGNSSLHVRASFGGGRVSAYADDDTWVYGAACGTATDIDDAREKADAFLVARGELEAGRAFKRIGDWEETPSGQSRASARHTVRVRSRADAVTGKVWEVFSVPGVRPVMGADGNDTGDAGKAAADAELVRRGLLAESRAFKVATKPIVLDAGGGVSAVVGLSHTVRMNRPITESTTVTLANWEQCLPLLLSSAPREFRDGFNRRQGKAWDAYLRGLAWVKEAIQLREIGAEARPGYVVAMATEMAMGSLGFEWAIANVREPLPKWEAAADSRPNACALQGNSTLAGGIRHRTIPDSNR